MLRTIAFVGLLSVLVYVGIRIIISSTGQEKAKYKKMIGDWLAAICILFVLHYIMALTMISVEKITGIFTYGDGIVNSSGEDVLMTSVRNQIGGEVSSLEFDTIFVSLLIYLALVAYTCVFTVHYLKRLVYLAFFTLIAPLIALTYPLDKIKDGQAQAFSMWVKEYIFNALLPVMHILLYYIFVGWSIDLTETNPLLALVCIGFLVPAEKFFRKMFGFDKATSSGQLGAAASGAMVMNAINKIGHSGNTQEKETKEKPPRINGNSGNVEITGTKGETKAPNTKAAESSQNGGGNGKQEEPQENEQQENAKQLPNANGQNTPDNNNSDTKQDTDSKTTADESKEELGNLSPTNWQNVKGYSEPESHFNVKDGLKKAAGNRINRKNVKNAAKNIGKKTFKGAGKLAGAAALGTIGLAAGIATGDPSKAFQYAGGAALAGSKLGENVSNKALNAGKSVWSVGSDFKKGAMGDAYDQKRAISSLKQDVDLVRACKDLGILNKFGLDNNNNFSKTIQHFAQNGITDPEEIKRALIAKQKYNKAHTNETHDFLKEREELIAFTKFSQGVGDSQWQNSESRAKLLNSVADRIGIGKAEELQEIINNMRNQ